MNRLDDVIAYPQDPQYARFTAAADSGDVRRDEAQRQGRAARHHLRLQPSGAAADRGLQPHRRARASASRSSAAAAAASRRSPSSSPASTSPGRARCCSTACRAQLPRDLITSSLAVVDQEVFLFGGTVTENVSMWDGTLPPRRMQDGVPGRSDRRRDRGARGTLRRRAGRGRQELQRRPAPAPRDRARAGRRADDPRARRGDERARLRPPRRPSTRACAAAAAPASSSRTGSAPSATPTRSS